MNDAEIREGMETIKTLKREATELNSNGAKADEECVGLNVDPEIVSEMMKAVKSAVNSQ